MAGSVKLLTSAGGGVVLDTATTTATDVTVKVPVTGVNNGTLVCSDSSGNVGIGTSSPSSYGRLAVMTPTANYGFFGIANSAGGAGGVNMAQYYGTTKISYIDSTLTNGTPGAETSFLAFATANSGTLAERMRIDSSGNLLIGTTSTSTSSAGAQITNVSGAYGKITLVKTLSGSASVLLNYYNGTYVGGIDVTNTATSFPTTSDYRLKHDIQPMQNALDTVAKLKPVTYKWNLDGSDGQGFIAHELQAVVPDCVTGEKDAVDAEGNPVYQGIDTSFLSATLTKAIQELSAKNDALEARIAALEAK